jgi:hypothetical protein
MIAQISESICGMTRFETRKINFEVTDPMIHAMPLFLMLEYQPGLQAGDAYKITAPIDEFVAFTYCQNLYFTVRKLPCSTAIDVLLLKV